MFELVPDDRAEVSGGEAPAHPPVNPDRAVGIRLTVGALLFVSLLLFTFVVANFQNRSVRPPAATEEAGKSEAVEAVKQDIEPDDTPAKALEPQQQREHELQEALDAAREELEALKAAVKTAEEKAAASKAEDQLMQQRLEAEKQRVERERAEQEQRQAELERQRLEQEKSQTELEQQRRDQEQREAELEALIELEMAREE